MWPGTWTSAGTHQGHPEAGLAPAFRQAQAEDCGRSPSTRSPSAKGHRYLTVVLDLVSGAVVFVGDGKGADALKPFWKRLRRHKAKIKAVAMDMSPAYHEAVSTHLPRATIVFDHFHVIKLFNEKLSDLRRWLVPRGDGRDAEEGPQGGALAAAEDCREPGRRAQTRRASGGGLELEQAAGDGLLHEGGSAAVLGATRQAVATAFLNGWIRRAEASGIKMLQQMAKTLAEHRTGLLAYYKYRSDRALGRDKQQDQDDEAAGLWVPRPRVLQAQDLGNPRDKYALVG